MQHENSPELDGKYLGTISNDFIKICDNLKEASYHIRDREFSKYPIFPIKKNGESEIGQLLIGRKEAGTQWNYNASFLEEFVMRELVSEEKKPAFIANYKNPDEFCCLFVTDGEFTRFVFIPYPED
ncbi:MAG: hypothetical protein L3J06_00900 [Cyclobacteriaceae bacterium]|nr:hypothetical protein [Cyclobacteriaceae bacterium]